MSASCSVCKPSGKCMRHRKSHDSINTPPNYESPVQWVSSSGHPLTNPVMVNEKYISRSTSSQPHNILVSSFIEGSGNDILIDPNNRTVWKPFTTDFEPQASEGYAIKANDGLSNWQGQDVYVGKVKLERTEVLGTIYTDYDCPWKLYVEGHGNIDEKKIQCEVLRDNLTIKEAAELSKNKKQ